MNTVRNLLVGMGVFGVLAVCAADAARGNEGPFVIRYPEGDVAANGVLARLDPSLRPGRETRLRVLDETLEVSFLTQLWNIVDTPTMRDRDPTTAGVGVNVTYRIENPTAEAIELDLGFPIVRGIAQNLYNVAYWHETPGDGKEKKVSPEWTNLSYSVIFGTIRERADAVLEKGIAADETLRRLVAAVRPGRAEADRQALGAYLTGPLKWSTRDAALLVEYASLSLGEARNWPGDADPYYKDWPANYRSAQQFRKLSLAHLGPLSAIGEQRATQFFAQLASRFDPAAGASYEAIYAGWGGTVRESSVDLATGQVRPREVELDRSKVRERIRRHMAQTDPTVYARVDYLDETAPISEAEKASCLAILRNLPVVFSFAPMSLIHYRVRFEPKTTHVVHVRYFQHAYLDTRTPRSYQIGYVLHPASFWEHFGPIHVKLTVPEGVPCRASVPLDGPELRPWGTSTVRRVAVHGATLAEQRTGQLLFGVDAAAWEKAHGVSPWVEAGLSEALPKR